MRLHSSKPNVQISDGKVTHLNQMSRLTYCVESSPRQVQKNDL